MSKSTLFAKLRDSRTSRIVCAFMVLNLLIEIVSPTMAFALTAGPTAPEFSSFEPVATTDMVNDFSGDFTYNIPILNVPGPDGGGYPMSLAYHSGSSSEEEASWVGLGWTLNPGAINRNKRGYPDEFDNINVERFNKSKPNWTQSTNFNVNVEISSSDGKNDEKEAKPAKNDQKMKVKFGLPGMNSDKEAKEEPASVSISFSKTIRFNNYSGFSIASGLGVGVKGMANLSMNRSGGQNTYGFSVNPIAIMSHIYGRKNEEQKKKADKKWSGKIAKAAHKLTNKLKDLTKNTKGIVKVRVPAYNLHTYNVPALPYSVSKNLGSSWNFNTSIVLNPSQAAIGGQIGFGGNMNMQVMEGYQTSGAYGYLYSWKANANPSNSLFDYQVEKETTFNKHDKNLGIPYNNADVFSSTGNGISGGFRFHHQQVGTFYPNSQTSITKIRQMGVEIGIGTDLQVGLTVGIGRQTTKVDGPWPHNAIGAYNPQYTAEGNASLRFMNDMGGEFGYGANLFEEPVTSTISVIGGLGTATSQFSLNSSNFVANPKSGHSSSIEYLKENISDPKLITGMIVTNKDGGRSHYTKPVYTRNEAELTVGVATNQDGAYLVTDNALNYDNPMGNKTVVGTKTSQWYSNSFLLEQNTTFNYIDVNNNGKTDDQDYGGWTKFDYKQAYGSASSNWYRFRTPYNGLNYNAGRMLDLKDQSGSMSSGEKEVYYLKSIQSKSHAAFFITNKSTLADYPAADFPFLYDNSNNPLPGIAALLAGSNTDRYDGVDAAAIVGGMDAAAASLTAKGNNKLQKLERIVLFAKADVSKPLTTTYFEYDYSLCQGIPNSVAPTNAPAKDKGKLTLKKVWTESNGVNRSQISPYIFNYEYFNAYQPQLHAKYPWLAAYSPSVYPTNDAKQNPVYKPEELDAWGNYQLNGAQRFANNQAWVAQYAQTNFDPAAWQLKRIQLPSGGEIHVHYEQKDYTHVQDKEAMAMVSLASDNNVKNGYDSDDAVYAINHADIGVPNDGNLTSYFNQVKKYFLDDKNKLYFKVLYTFKGDDDPSINSGSDRYEYVTGYTKVNDVTFSGGKIFLHLGDEREDKLAEIIGDKKKDKTLPRYVCYQELLSNGALNLGKNATSYKDKDYTSLIYPNTATSVNPPDLSYEILSNLFGNTCNMFVDWLKGDIRNPKRKEVCKSINYSLSYFKLPTYYAKKGGGIRVKRILTYDKGIETGDPMLFGSEYLYVGKDGRSSGVATNEPPEIREENALVNMMERKKQKFIDKITNGRDTKQSEGPLGENLLPGAEVEHSRIVIKNIHSGKSTTGFAVNEYHTCKDFPMEVDYTQIKKKVGGGGTYKKFQLNLPLGLFNMDLNRAWVTQGYVFKLNDMNGKIASKATYAGNYEPGNFNESAFTSKTSYNYSVPGGQTASLVFDPNTKQIVKSYLSPGKEEDYTIFSSSVTERTCDFSIELDINFTWLALYLTFSPSFSYSDHALRQHVTSRVINQTSYLLSTTNITDGVAQTTENLAFDRYTGDPVLTRTFDGYMSPQGKINMQNDGVTKHSGFYYSMNFPASWMYSSMGPKTYSLTNTNQLSAMAGNVVTYSTNSLYDMVTNTATAIWTPSITPLTNVVSASATQFTNNWFAGTNSLLATTYTALNTPSVSTKANQFFYPLRTYSYKDNVTNANTPVTGRIYQGGVITTPFKMFDWVAQQQTSPPLIPTEWYSDSKVTKYSPFGYPIEEQDVLAISSAAQFGYNDILPVAVGQNTSFEQFKFVDFEYGNAKASSTSASAHTGLRALDLQANANYTFVPLYPVTSDIITKKGLSVKLWLKSSQSNVITSPNYQLKNPNPQLKVNIGGVFFNMEAIAQTGEWTLYSAEIKNFYNLTVGNHHVKLAYAFMPNEEVYVDDFRIQPLDASMNCSVYNKDHKLAAQFDDQHFAVLYEYDNKGQLTRKGIETTRGMKTLQEQQYNTPLINK